MTNITLKNSYKITFIINIRISNNTTNKHRNSQHPIQGLKLSADSFVSPSTSRLGKFFPNFVIQKSREFQYFYVVYIDIFNQYNLILLINN